MEIVAVDRHVVGTEWHKPRHRRVRTDEGLTGLGELALIDQTDALLGYPDEAARSHELHHAAALDTAEPGAPGLALPVIRPR